MPSTETQAHARLCPAMTGVARVEWSCQGSRCMAWRWVYDPATGAVKMARTSGPVPCATCQGTGKVPKPEAPPKGGKPQTVACHDCDGAGEHSTWEALGYCGLAGVPAL